MSEAVIRRVIMPHSNYPQCVLEVVDDQMTYRPEVIHVVRRFAQRQPWRGTVEDREAKFEQLNRDLAVAYGIAMPALNFKCIDGSSSGSSHYIPTQHRIVLVGKLSVVTYLHEFAHALGMDERGACQWSINLFKRCFPQQYGRLVHVGHMLIRPADVASGLRGRRAS